MANFFLKDFRPTVNLSSIKEKPIEHAQQYLREFFQHFGVSDEDLITKAISLFSARIYRKNSLFLTEGEVSTHIGFIVNGAVEAFYTDNNRMQVLLLLMEEDFIADIRSFLYQQPSRINLRFTEDSITLEINHADFLDFIQANKQFAELLQKVMADVMGAIMQHNLLLKLPARSRYEHLLANKPEIFNRFLLQDIASFIGVKQETLSRARGRYKKKA